MRLPWKDFGDGRGLTPSFRAAVRRNDINVGLEAIFLLDTGADGTLLPLHMAKKLGFGDNDLHTKGCTGAAGPVGVQRPIDIGKVEIHVGGRWIRVPRIDFGNTPVALLGREAIFTHFDLSMTLDDFELHQR